jgi:DNA-binding transcriptional LysR family regulator
VLERELGVQLFDRSRFSKKVTLTEVGRRTFDYAGRLLALADETEAAVHADGEARGPLRVSAPDSLLTYRLPDLLHRFQMRYPQVQLILLSGADRQMQTTALLEGDLDIAFVVDELMESSRLTVKCLAEEEIVKETAPDHPATKSEDFKLEDLVHTQTLLTDKSSTYRLLWERVLSPSHVRLASTLELGSIEAMKQCAIAGMGFALLPRIAVVTELKRKRLVELPWAGARFHVYIQILRRRDRETTPALRAFWGMAEQNLETKFTPQTGGESKRQPV